MIQVYVDGSYSTSKTKIGSGVVILYHSQVLEFGFSVEAEEGHSRNVSGELNSVIHALELCSGIVPIEGMVIEDKHININYDYLGIENWINGSWAAKTKTTKDYVSKFNEIVNEHDLKVTFNKIKAHTGNIYNDIADRLAKESLD